MSEYVIFTDACADLTPALVKETGIEVIPMTFTLHGKQLQQYPDHRELASHDFYEAIQSGELPTTAAINVQEYIDLLTPHLESEKDVLILAFSSGLSSTYQNAVIAAEELSAAYPQRHICAVDSRAASLGQGLLAWYAAKLRSEGKTIEETRDWLENNKLRVCHWFTVEDLNHLKRGGRCSPTTAWLGTMLGIKPVLHFDDEGKLLPVRKARGRQASLAALLDEMEKNAVNPAEQVVFISHADAETDALKVRDMISEKFGISEFRIGPISPVIGSHTGQGTVALFFFAKDRNIS